MGKSKTKREFETLSSELTYVKMDDVEKGSVIEGTITEVRIKEAHGKFPEQKQVILQADGSEKKTGLPSHFTINDKLIGKKDDDEFVDRYVRLTYEGQADAKGKRKGVHLWKVEMAK